MHTVVSRLPALVMLFFPYASDLPLARFAWLTCLISVLCLVVFAAQEADWHGVAARATVFCEEQRSGSLRVVLGLVKESADREACLDVMFALRYAADAAAEIDALAEASKPMHTLDEAASRDYVSGVLDREFRRFESTVPADLTSALWYLPSSWSIPNMITTSFAHGDWLHVIFNVFFFAAFAATIEVIVGPAAFIALVIGASIFIGCAYSLTSLLTGVDNPTVGLSGVVTAMMALFAFLLPSGRVRCFLWLFVFFRTFAIPAWILAVWYIGGDLYNLLFVEEHYGVNIVAHVAGAAFGLLVGFAFFGERKHELRALARRAMHGER